MEQNQLFDAVKLALKKTRVTSLDGEIERLVAAAKADLAAAGVCKIEDDDENIKQACVLYGTTAALGCAYSHFGLGNAGWDISGRACGTAGNRGEFAA